MRDSDTGRGGDAQNKSIRCMSEEAERRRRKGRRKKEGKEEQEEEEGEARWIRRQHTTGEGGEHEHNRQTRRSSG